MGSLGECVVSARVAPFWGVLSARGWEWAFQRLQWNEPIRWAGAAVLLPPIVVNAVHPIVPVHLREDWQMVRKVADWYRQDPSFPARYPKVMTAHPGISYFLDIDRYNTCFDTRTLHAHEPGTILMWSPVHGDKNSAADRAFPLEDVAKNQWIEAPGDRADSGGASRCKGRRCGGAVAYLRQPSGGAGTMSHSHPASLRADGFLTRRNEARVLAESFAGIVLFPVPKAPCCRFRNAYDPLRALSLGRIRATASLTNSSNASLASRSGICRGGCFMHQAALDRSARPFPRRGRACSSGWRRRPRRRCWASLRRSGAAPGSCGTPPKPVPSMRRKQTLLSFRNGTKSLGPMWIWSAVQRDVELALDRLGLADLLARAAARG